ncbi:hypothetical protein FA15DRAFT_755502 [Coprinopsis marcescibilis]|uniref:ER-bound oxygenase mpaB/mpaB'/Rubber oxygenase catalytic domain-containing protein n=1 Tax=Coprinopsis marcescibilis TaxID=230819 RepID=A0A5C3KZ29_COPMA|nr:hypothetical protein FA15DRAFT_755502 [Coprinopsis marcescibilis]
MSSNQPNTATVLVDSIISLIPGSLRALPTSIVLLTLFLGYLTLVQLLRWRRYNAVHQQYQRKFDKGELTPDDAQKIMQLASAWDMPFAFGAGYGVGILRTFSIPTVSKLFYATKEMATVEKVVRRYADTEILLTTASFCPLSGFHDISLKTDISTPAQDPRTNIAIARINYLHGKYKISNDDYLFTLYGFMSGPLNMIDRYGWRALSPLERAAVFIFWAELGRKMGIQDIPATMEELATWCQAYEEKHMVPTKINNIIGNVTLWDNVVGVPERFGLRRLVERLVICLMDDRMREAFMWEAQPQYMHLLAKGLMYLSMFMQRWLLLPRSEPLCGLDASLPGVEAFGKRFRPTIFRWEPWYKPESSGLGYLMDVLLVKLGHHAGVPGKRFKSEGYRLEELGPERYEQVGHEEVFREAERIQGCPIPSYYFRR